MFKLVTYTILLFFFSSSFAQEIENCNFLTEKYGKQFNLPNKLLTSIALVESGLKKEKKEFGSWPWTLNVAGKSIYFNNKKETLSFLKKKLNSRKSIDVGCMQINTKYHLKNFNSLEQLIEPEENVKYAASFLSSLHKKHRSWNEAISRYHSSIPKKKQQYLKRVYSYWNNLRQRKIKIKSNYENQNNEKIKFFREILEKEKI